MGTPELIQSTSVVDGVPRPSWCSSSVQNVPTERHHTTAKTGTVAVLSPDGDGPLAYFVVAAL
jgi:hypothetical protein